MRARWLLMLLASALLSTLGLLLSVDPLLDWTSGLGIELWKIGSSTGQGWQDVSAATNSSAGAAACSCAPSPAPTGDGTQGAGDVPSEVQDAGTKSGRGGGKDAVLRVYGRDEERNLSGFQALTNMSLEDAFYSRRVSLPISGMPEMEVPRADFATRFLPNHNAFAQYPLFSVENICLEPVAARKRVVQYRWVVVNARVPSGPSQETQEFQRMWSYVYNTSEEGRIRQPHNAVSGARLTSQLPANASVRWVEGNTLHFHPYGGNAMHNWNERVWPHIARFWAPLNATTPHPVRHFLIHQFDHNMKHAHLSLSHQILWQVRLLMELAPEADNLLVEGLQTTACFRRVLMQPFDLDRMDFTRVPDEVSGPAMRNLRHAALAFFGLATPRVRLPPEKLKVVFYGRRDTTRRRVMNGDEVVAYLRNMSRPPLEVYSLDDMMASKEIGYAFPDILSLHYQTDIWIVGHGANIWGSILLPDGAAIIELFGPCNWSPHSPNRIYRPNITGPADPWKEVHTWSHVNSLGAHLKHDLSNPWLTALPPPGSNSTRCVNIVNGTPDFTVDTQFLGRIIQQMGWPSWPEDRLTQHWLYDWTKEGYGENLIHQESKVESSLV